ncbi:meiotic recombination protein DMC1 homolog isoform X2 [Eucalyptus grandis]|uniref:meiotic recombination protein DMC1 homolog isoform X2 n=1 Tax=Eucalyptus grandis TaxID=71139 RepID=UPI00192EE125|nr:meiotic recombination protein DMC1 homolog isoform X2 [Eucalyptus grandis]
MNLKIIYTRASTSEHHYNLLLDLAARMYEEPFKLLIVDSVNALFRVDFTGRELAEHQVDPETIKSCKLLFCSLSGLTLMNSKLQQKLAQMLSRLIKIAEESNVAVYMTNQADPGGGVSSDPMKPAGGHVLARAATIRLMFRKVRREQHVSKVFDAPNLPEAEAISFLCQIFL